MSRIFKRLAFALSVPTTLAVGGWAQWTTLTAQDATVAVSTADASRVDVPRERPDPSAADARITPVLDRTAGSAAQPPVPPQKKIVTYRIKPAPIPDRTAGSGAQPPVPAVKAETELAQADAVTYPPIKPAAGPDRTAGVEAQPPVPAVKVETEVAQADAVTYPPIKPAASPDRTAGSGVQPPVPAVKADTELAQADAVPYPRIKPAPSPDRTAKDGTTGPVEGPTPAVKADTEFVQAIAAPLDPSIEPAPADERGSGEKVALAEQQPSGSLANNPSTSNPSTNRSSTTETKKERQAALPRETKEGRSTRDREREGESRRSKDAAAANARKTIVAKTIVAMRQRAEPARYQWSGPATPALRDHPMRLRAWAASRPRICH